VKIAIGADHHGFFHKKIIKERVVVSGISIEWFDVGAFDQTRSDYPIFSERVCKAMLCDDSDVGVLICGTGVGMAIAANRFKKIYAGLAWNEQIARLGREDDNTNVLVLPSDFVSADQAVTIVCAWLKTSFQGGRYQERIAMIDSFGPC